MGDVVELKKPAPAAEPEEPYIAGTGCCMVCLHEWAAVAPVGTHELQCPQCGTVNGVWKNPVFPDKEKIWVCSCDNYFFTIVQGHGAMCAACGKLQTW